MKRAVWIRLEVLRKADSRFGEAVMEVVMVGSEWREEGFSLVETKGSLVEKGIVVVIVVDLVVELTM